MQSVISDMQRVFGSDHPRTLIAGRQLLGCPTRLVSVVVVVLGCSAELVEVAALPFERRVQSQVPPRRSFSLRSRQSW